MSGLNNSEDLEGNIRKWAADEGLVVLDSKTLFDGIYNRYTKPSLSQVISEELPQIIDADPNFFEKYDLNLPVDPETYLFELYYSSYGTSGMEQVHHSSKVWFRHIRFFLLDHPDKKELNHAIDEYKKILSGTYLERYL